MSSGTPDIRATIDIGTNSVKLLVAEVSQSAVYPLWEGSSQTRLGRGFYPSFQLPEEAIRQTALAVHTFVDTAREWGASTLRVFATSAAREALNAHQLLDAIRQETGVETEILTGEQEADWVFRGVTSDPRFEGQRLLIADVGGGSTELILGQGGNAQFSRSFPLGSVRLLEVLQPSEPPQPRDLERCREWIAHLIDTQVLPAMSSLLPNAPAPSAHELVATGGAATILARMHLKTDHFDRTEIEEVRLTSACVEEYVETLWALPIEERRRVPGIPPKRADVILTGTAIYAAILKAFHFSQMRVSTRGLRFAAILAGDPNATAARTLPPRPVSV